MVAADRGHLADLETKRRRLDQHLRVENEIVAVLEKGDCLEKTPRIRAVAGVVFGETQPEHLIF